MPLLQEVQDVNGSVANSAKSYVSPKRPERFAVLELQELQERLQYYRTALDAAKHRHMGWDGSWNKRVKKPTGDRKTNSDFPCSFESFQRLK